MLLLHVGVLHSSLKTSASKNKVRMVFHAFGHAITQAVSRWLPTAVARVRGRLRTRGICDGQSGAGVGFLRALLFPLPNFISSIAPQSPSSIILGWCNRPVVAAVTSGLSLAPLTIIKNKEVHAFMKYLRKLGDWLQVAGSVFCSRYGRRLLSFLPCLDRF
jgi:hypothetical protein